MINASETIGYASNGLIEEEYCAGCVESGLVKIDIDALSPIFGNAEFDNPINCYFCGEPIPIIVTQLTSSFNIEPKKTAKPC